MSTKLEDNRRQHELACLERIQSAANTWLDLSRQKHTSPLSDADKKRLEGCRRFLVGVAKDNPNSVPGEDFADVVRHLRKTAIRRRAQLFFDSLPQSPGRAEQNRNGYSRDKFIYDSMAKGQTRAVIKNQVNARKRWESLESEQAISAAAKRYAQRNNLPWPIKRTS